MLKDVTQSFIELMLDIKRQFRCAAPDRSRGPLARLTLGQLEALHFVGRQREVLMKDLADYLAITPPSATSLAANLAKLRLVRQSAGKDRRQVHVSLTPQGTRLLRGTMRRRDRMLRALFVRLTEAEQRQLLGLIRKLTI